MDTKRLPEIIREMYKLIDELEAMFEGRHFTPDGHTVGSIGEAIARHYYGLKLLPASTKGHDAVIEERPVEIKATQGDSIVLREKPDHLLELVGNKPLPKNGQYQVRCRKLEELMASVPQERRLPRVDA